MKGLREKFRKNEGFTLVEMLIVVAIIAILIAVSIPLVGTSLEKARQATDSANLRSAKAEATIMYMNDQINGGTPTLAKDMRYDIGLGKFVAAGSVTDGYNQSKVGSFDDPKSAVIAITALTKDAEEPFTVDWVAK